VAIGIKQITDCCTKSWFGNLSRGLEFAIIVESISGLQAVTVTENLVKLEYRCRASTDKYRVGGSGVL